MKNLVYPAMKKHINLFTPRIRDGQGWDRLTLFISNEDCKKIHRGRQWKATITDIKSGRVFKVRGASCGFSRCFCDAIVKEVT